MDEVKLSKAKGGGVCGEVIHDVRVPDLKQAKPLAL